MNILIIGHGDSRKRLPAIARMLRDGRHMVESYYDDHLDLVNERRKLPPTDLLVLGLSKESSDPGSKAFQIEQDILRRATSGKVNIPCCLVHDGNGNVSAPYLKEVGTRIDFVVTLAAHDGDHGLTDLTEKADIRRVEPGGARYEVCKIVEALSQSLRTRAQGYA